MKASRKTKRALIPSILAVIMCVAMLIGTTFAWFTDTASTSVNKIEAGKLDVQLLYADNATGTAENTKWEEVKANTTLNFLQKSVSTEGAESTETIKQGANILWEPGCTYSLPALKIVNNGNLALKYKIVITGINGDAELNKAIKWTIANDADGSNAANLSTTEYHLTAKDTDNDSDIVTIKGYMEKEAGNEYQEKYIDGITITVYAKQDTVEYDSSTQDYDNQAEYDKVAYSTVSSSNALVDAITNAKDATGTATNKVVANLTTTGNYTLPKLEGKDVTITGDGDKDTVVDMTSAGNGISGNVQNQADSAQFEGVTVKFDTSTNYTGFVHTGKLVYKDCTISGFQYLYADEVEFINCIFEQTENDKYHICTYSAKNVTFTDCTFKSTENSKAVYCYWDGGSGETLTRTFNNCTFTCSGTPEKSAIMINPSANGTNTYVVNINNCTAKGYGSVGISGQTIVGVKEIVKDNITVNIDDTAVYTHTAA